MKLVTWQCYNSQYLGKDEIFGWLPELAQKCLSSLALSSFERVFLIHIRSLQKLLLCLLVFHKSTRGTNMPPPLPHTVPLRVQIAARFSKYHTVLEFFSLLLQTQSLLSCCHLLFALLLRSYNGTTLDGSSSFQGLSTFTCIMHLSLVLPSLQLC